MKHGKNIKKVYESFDTTATYTLAEGIDILKKVKFSKFNETVEVAINLGVDPRHADQNIRGAALMPKGLGKTVRILVFCQGENETIAKTAGADYVGGEDLANKIQSEGWMDFDVVVATPDMMRVVGKLGKILGPRGLMPNPKTGTVTANVAEAIRELKAGKVSFRVDKKGIIHAPVGKIAFETGDLIENIDSLVDVLKKLKPSSSKGIYFKKMTVSSTMGPGVKVDVSSVVK
jgi:large subunit ribosomal protein L1